MKSISRLICFATLMFNVNHTFAVDATFESGNAVASMRITNTQYVDVTIETIEPSSNSPYIKSYTWGGDNVHAPKSIISKISITNNGKSIFLPLSSFSDLGNPRKVSLEHFNRRGFQLSISGGDAAGSYIAALYFNENEILSRKVFSGEFPKEVWEKTKYSFNHQNN